jgi:hypothetical protein
MDRLELARICIARYEVTQDPKTQSRHRGVAPCTVDMAKSSDHESDMSHQTSLFAQGLIFLSLYQFAPEVVFHVRASTQAARAAK